MNIIKISKNEIIINGIHNNLVCFSYLGHSLKYNNGENNILLDLGTYEIYLNGKLKWTNDRSKKLRITHNTK